MKLRISYSHPVGVVDGVETVQPFSSLVGMRFDSFEVDGSVQDCPGDLVTDLIEWLNAEVWSRMRPAKPKLSLSSQRLLCEVAHVDGGISIRTAGSAQLVIQELLDGGYVSHERTLGGNSCVEATPTGLALADTLVPTYTADLDGAFDPPASWPQGGRITGAYVVFRVISPSKAMMTLTRVLGRDGKEVMNLVSPPRTSKNGPKEYGPVLKVLGQDENGNDIVVISAGVVGPPLTGPDKPDA